MPAFMISDGADPPPWDLRPPFSTTGRTTSWPSTADGASGWSAEGTKGAGVVIPLDRGIASERGI